MSNALCRDLTSGVFTAKRHFAKPLSIATIATLFLASLDLSIRRNLLPEDLALSLVAIVLVAGLIYSALNPDRGYLLALALLPVDFGFAIPHTITSAPSSYLIAGAFLGVCRKGNRWKLALSRPLILWPTAATAAAAAIGFAVADIRGLLPWKYAAAELIGILIMTAFLTVPAALIREEEDIRRAVWAVSLGIIFVLFGAVAGSVTTLACLPTDLATPFVVPGLRLTGFAPDPNRLGLITGALMLLPVLSEVDRRSLFAHCASGFILSIVVVLSGSRSGVVAALFCALAAVLIGIGRRNSRLIAIGLLVAATTSIGAKTLWPHLPCPFSRGWDIVTFSERNDPLAYYSRVGSNHDVEHALEVEKAQEKGLWNRSLQKTPRAVVVLREKAAPMLQFIGLDWAREALWDDAVSYGINLLPFGAGIGQMPAYNSSGWRAHNTVITVFFEMGVFGMAALTVLSLAAAMAAYRIMRTSAGTIRQQGVAIFIVSCGIGLGCLSQDMLRAEPLWGLLGLLLTIGSANLAPVIPLSEERD